ncbi:hypothetical protein RvY_02059 [Ramazzottius varieornatus]|uniref:Uncharacterized protein n=1 Tax=Ramazzottius varieornatus TaxID=947166 RepID=A0A1D1UM75_RAMVA|nr:hypothetical protein RvY_02059 [Ramazzottius varieornatus]
MSASEDSDQDEMEMEEGGEKQMDVEQLVESNSSDTNEAVLPDLSKIQISSSSDHPVEMIPLSA